MKAKFQLKRGTRDDFVFKYYGYTFYVAQLITMNSVQNSGQYDIYVIMAELTLNDGAEFFDYVPGTFKYGAMDSLYNGVEVDTDVLDEYIKVHNNIVKED